MATAFPILTCLGIATAFATLAAVASVLLFPNTRRSGLLLSIAPGALAWALFLGNEALVRWQFAEDNNLIRIDLPFTVPLLLIVSISSLVAFAIACRSLRR